MNSDGVPRRRGVTGNPTGETLFLGFLFTPCAGLVSVAFWLADFTALFRVEDMMQ